MNNSELKKKWKEKKQAVIYNLLPVSFGFILMYQNI